MDCGSLDIPHPGERPPIFRGPGADTPSDGGGNQLQENTRKGLSLDEN